MATIAEAFAIALQHHGAGNLGPADQLLQQIVQADPTHAEAWHTLGIVAYQTGRHDRAADCFGQAVRLAPWTATYHCNLGLAHEALAQFGDAAASFQQALRLQPDLVEAHGNLANVLLRQGTHEAAAAHYREALRLRPNFAESHFGLGTALTDLGKLDEAVAHLRQALALRPQFAEANHNLGNALLSQGKPDEAAAQYQEALRLRPGFAQAHNGLGNVALGLNQFDQAAAHFRQALVLWPQYPEAHANLASALIFQDKVPEAMVHCQEALRLRPDYADAFNTLGNALLRQKKTSEAAASYRQALHFNPNLADAHNGLGCVFEQQNQLDEAMRCYGQALQLNPRCADALNNQGNVLARQENLAEAARCYREAIRVKPHYAQAHFNLGNTFERQAQFEEAIRWYGQALELDPPAVLVALAHWNRAVVRLLLGDFEQGWPEYEWRWELEGVVRRPCRQPLWDGSPLQGQTILIYGEQGLGDTLQFIRYAPMLKQRGGKVIVECEPRLVRLLASAPGVDAVLPEGSGFGAFDVHLPLLSLPHMFRTNLGNIPATVPYLWPSDELMQKWKRDLEPFNGFKIGIVWQGRPSHPRDGQRSVPLVSFSELAKVDGVRLISLQTGPATEKLRELAAQFAVHDAGSGLVDFMDTAAAVKNLDLVISCDTAVAHLAGAMGVPVWVALPLVPDWRWLLEREDSPWYPTMRLFRQSNRGDWQGVFERMATTLGKKLAGG